MARAMNPLRPKKRPSCRNPRAATSNSSARPRLRKSQRSNLRRLRFEQNRATRKEAQRRLQGYRMAKRQFLMQAEQQRGLVQL